MSEDIPEGIRKISAVDLCEGMYVVDLGFSWMDNPYLYAQEGLVLSDRAAESVREQGFLEVFVDPGRSQAPIPDDDLNKVINGHVDLKSLEPKVTLEDEMRGASALYGEALGFARSALDRCAWQKPLDMDRVEPIVAGMMDSLSRNGAALITLSKLRSSSDHLFNHSVNVAVLAMYFGRFLGLHPITLKRIGQAGLFHDIGMSEVPEVVIKSRNKLSPDDLCVVRRHPLAGHEILKQKADVYPEVLEGALEHHERFNGNGYPHALAGDKISVVGRILALADSYDALTSDRPHRRAFAPHKALSVIYGMRGQDFDPSFVERFIQGVGVYPLGSAVELNTGQSGVVIRANPENPLRPMLSLLTDPRGKPVPPRTVDLSGQNTLRIINCKESAALRSAITEGLDVPEG